VLFITEVPVGRGKVIRVEVERFIGGELDGLVCVVTRPLWEGATQKDLMSAQKLVDVACRGAEELLAV